MMNCLHWTLSKRWSILHVCIKPNMERKRRNPGYKLDLCEIYFDRISYEDTEKLDLQMKTRFLTCWVKQVTPARTIIHTFQTQRQKLNSKEHKSNICKLCKMTQSDCLQSVFNILGLDERYPSPSLLSWWRKVQQQSTETSWELLSVPNGGEKKWKKQNLNSAPASVVFS